MKKIMLLIPFALNAMEYVPKGAQRIPPVSCIFRVEGIKGLYQVPNIGFMVKLAKNKWRKAPIVDNHELIPFSKSFEGLIQMDGTFMVCQSREKIYIKTYWPYDHLRTFAVNLVSAIISENKNSDPYRY